jgi:WD40 repeat protein
MLLHLLCALQAPALEHELYRAQIAAAEAAMRLGELSVARTWLDETDPKLRGFEWRVHDASLDQSLASWPSGSSHAVALAESPDGATLACGLEDGKVELRSSSDGRVVATLDAHADALSFVRFDDAGARLVTASHDRTVKVWDVAARKLELEFKGHGFPVGGASFSPDGSLVASCSYERPPGTVVGTVRLWDSVDGTVLRTLEGGRKPLVGIAFSPDGRRIAAGSWDFCVFVWSVDGGAPVKCAVPDEGIYNAVDGVAWSPDGKLVAGASKDKTARVWNAESGALVATLRGHTDYVGKLAFSPDGATLATASSDGTVRLWNTADWSARSALRGHGDDVTDVCCARDGGRWFTASEDGTVRAWDARTPWYGGQVVRATRAAYVASYSPDDARIASASYDGRIQVWNADTLELEASWQAHPDGKSCHALGWTADGKQLFSGSWEPVVRLWDVETRAEVAAFEQPDGTGFLATSPAGAAAATCAGTRVFVYDLAKRAKLLEFDGHAKAVLSANFGPDGKRVVSTARDGQAIVWDAATGAVAFSIDGPGPDVAEAQFTPDGKQIVVAGRGGIVTLHSAVDGSKVRELAHLRHGIDHLDVSPDGSRVALASDTVVLLDLAHGRVVGQLRPHAEHPYDVDFDSKGLRLASCSTDRTIAISETRPLRELLAKWPGR